MVGAGAPPGSSVTTPETPVPVAASEGTASATPMTLPTILFQKQAERGLRPHALAVS
jgi:hypothetical protein